MMRNITLLCLWQCLCLFPHLPAAAFSTTPVQRIRTSPKDQNTSPMKAPLLALRLPTSLNSKGKKNMDADFEYQELKIQLQAMKDQNVVTGQLLEPKRKELEGYIRRILARRESPIPLYEMKNHIPGTEWRLTYSTQPLTASSLPNDVRIGLKFLDEQTLDYCLDFTKTFGLNKLTARSSYQVESSPVSPGLLSYSYENITTDIFGLKNLGLGMMGLLQGRMSQIPTAYFDEQLWIEVGKENGFEYFNVYTRE